MQLGRVPVDLQADEKILHGQHDKEGAGQTQQWATCGQAMESGLGTSVMIEKFASVRRGGESEFLDLNHTSKPMILVSLFDSEVRSGRQHRGLANFGIGTLVETHVDG
jgi:hypothetical protein